MRTYELKMLGTMRAKVQIEQGNVLDLVRRLRRGEWIKDADGEYINPAHVSSVRLVRS